MSVASGLGQGPGRGAREVQPTAAPFCEQGLFCLSISKPAPTSPQAKGRQRIRQ